MVITTPPTIPVNVIFKSYALSPPIAANAADELVAVPAVTPVPPTFIVDIEINSVPSVFMVNSPSFTFAVKT